MEADLTSVEPEDLPGLELGRRYAHAPIVEAILELQVRNRDDLTVEELARLGLEGDFAEATPIFNVEGQLEFVDGAFTSQAHGAQVGWAHQRTDGQRVVQAGIDRFTFIWRGPYDNWDAFADEAWTHWNNYLRTAEPLEVGLIGVRFVNRIPMRKVSIEIKDYLRTSVELSPYLPQAVNALFMQVEMPLNRYQANATITSAMDTSPNPETGQPAVALILDIDTKAELNRVTDDPEFDAALRAIVGRLRTAKNYVFEACITDATRGLID
ncbi:TIGR04255 family protein [Nocardioides ungokensis]|uniref:TIGR04255 family protein n=1 Tax=Nocardioides ungokensis TaxID=1643322 RepID=UPI0015DFB903|nr:TIGR04255 family protein [Nocardioides ungokensis]